MSIYDQEPLDFTEIKTYELSSRPSKVTFEDFASADTAHETFSQFVDSLPKILAAADLREFTRRINVARQVNKPIIWGIGGHVIKTGLAPILIDLMNRGFVTAIAVNGSVLVHDSEIATVGFTSEDVDATLGAGDFGAAKETGELINGAANGISDGEMGLAEAVSKRLVESLPEFEDYSVLCAAYNRKIPVTAHITIGADIGNFHPGADGGALGAASYFDFKLFCSLVREMNDGGVYINFGSAVTLPEIFLKAVTINRNLGNDLQGITTANFDFIQHYRPLTNVVKRPNAQGAGKGFAFTGHHEIMLPLLAAMLTSVQN
ncbi:MAG: hypothetical protein ACK5NT_13555 [Pyrinomonadaceae bacterium]